MDRKSGRNKTIMARRYIFGSLVILINLILLFKIMEWPIKYIWLLSTLVLTLVILVKVFKFTFSKLVVAFIILSNFGYAYTVMELMRDYGQEPNYLTMAFFGFTTVELWSLAGITKKKEETRQKELKYQDENYG